MFQMFLRRTGLMSKNALEISWNVCFAKRPSKCQRWWQADVVVLFFNPTSGIFADSDMMCFAKSCKSELQRSPRS